MIVLLGASGQIGRLFAAKLRERGRDFVAVQRADVDWQNPASLRRFFERVEASFVINCVGYVGRPNVDACERDRANCLFANAVLPGHIVAACRSIGIPWSHISSACIFSGNGPEGAGFDETDCPNFSFRSPPCSFYSGSKAMGEEILGWSAQVDNRGRLCWVPESPPDGYIWRLRMPFGNAPGPRNYLGRVASYPRLLEATNSITDLSAFIDACLQCIEKTCPFGIYHLCNSGAITTRRITEMMLAENQRKRDRGEAAPFPETFHFFKDEEEFCREASPVPRSNCILRTNKARVHGIALEPVEQAVARALSQWPSGSENDEVH